MNPRASGDAIRDFVDELSRASLGSTVNQYRFEGPDDRVGGAAIRRENLIRYLEERVGRTRFLLVGEAAGYQGCRFSGIAFTSERYLDDTRRTSTHPRGRIEPSATIMHGVLHDLGIERETVLWNVCPLHPCKPDRAMTNRHPTAGEIAQGQLWTQRVFELLEPVQMIPVGRVAGEALGIPHVRHPSFGGKAKFTEQMNALVTAGHTVNRPANADGAR